MEHREENTIILANAIELGTEIMSKISSPAIRAPRDSGDPESVSRAIAARVVNTLAERAKA